MQISLLKRNIAANFLGRGFAAVLSIVAIPFYIRFLGIEAYGIIGFFTSLTALATIFDFGLTTTANRELARLSMDPDKSRTARDLTRSLEIISWCSAVALGALAALAADPIARGWLQIETLDPDEVVGAVTVMAIALLFQLPLGFYSGSLMGLQRQVLLNLVNAIGASIQVIGAIGVLWFVSPSLIAFFLWFTCARGLHTAILGFLVWRSLPSHRDRPRFRLEEVRKVWHFAAGMTGISVLGLILMQIDVVILSRLLPLSEFGYYALAKVVAQAMYIFVAPVFAAVFPHFSQLIARGDTERLTQTYHRASQVIAVAVIPAALVIAFFSKDLLWAWTGDSTTVANAAVLVSLLTIGTGLNGIQNVPYALQLADGWVSFALRANVIALVFIGPTIVFLTNAYGAVGAASAWILLNLGMMTILLPIMHRRLLTGELFSWFVQDLARPLLPALAVTGLAYLVLPSLTDRLTAVVALALIFGAAALASIVAVPWLRGEMTQQLSAILGKQHR